MLGNDHRKKQVCEKLHNRAVRDLSDHFRSPVPVVKCLENNNLMLREQQSKAFFTHPFTFASCCFN